MPVKNDVQIVEFNHFYGVPLHCPYCGASPEGDLREGGRIAPCPHTLIVGHSEFWSYVAPRAEAQIQAAGFRIERDGDQMEILHDDEDLFMVEDVIGALDFPDAVMFKQVVGPPAMEFSFSVFAGVEED